MYREAFSFFCSCRTKQRNLADFAQFYASSKKEKESRYDAAPTKTIRRFSLFIMILTLS